MTSKCDFTDLSEPYWGVELSIGVKLPVIYAIINTVVYDIKIHKMRCDEDMRCVDGQIDRYYLLDS